MKQFLLLLCLLAFSPKLFAQELTGSQLLEKAITYHDPNGNWPSFSGEFSVTMEQPDSADRISDIKINLPQEYFSVTAVRDTLTTIYTIEKGECTSTVGAPTNSSRTPCETAELYKNYYTYLYGLPMKLRDEGTIIDPKVERKSFQSKEYLVLKASYEEEVGSDVWFFYFDPTTYAMEIYQFFKGDPDGRGKETGEYILLSKELMVNGIKMPKDRAWYYNKGDKYLGTDILKAKEKSD